MMTGDVGRSPPRLAKALLALCLPPGVVRETVLGDLQEMYEDRVAKTSVPSVRRRRSKADRPMHLPRLWASGWYWSQVPLVGGRYLLRRLTHRRFYQTYSPEPTHPPAGHQSTRGWAIHGMTCDLRSGLSAGIPASRSPQCSCSESESAPSA